MRRTPITNQIRSYFGSKLVLNTYIILFMRLFASASGFLFWAVTARLLPAGEVGLASGVVSAGALLAGLAQLGLGYGLVRHLSGSQTPGRLLNAVLAVVAADGLLLGAVFLAGLSLWSPALLPLRVSPQSILTFVVLVVATGLTQLLNWYFLARRSPIYSLVKNTGQSVLAVILLVALGLRSGNYMAAVEAYTLATLISLVIAVLAFVPRLEPGYAPGLVLPRTIRTTFAGYALTNFAADQFTRVVNTVVPLMVLNLLGPVTAAYFFIVWSIGAGLGSLTESAASSFFAEGAHRPENIGAYTRRAIKLALLISSASAVASIVMGRFVLMIYGPEYVVNGYWPLVLLALTLIPTSIVPVYETYLRVRDQLSALVLFSAFDITIGLASLYLFMVRFGLIGAFVGWLVSRLVLVAVMAVIWHRQTRPVVSVAGGSTD